MAHTAVGPAGGSLTNVYVAGIEGSPTGQGTLNGSAVAITGTRMPLDGLYVVADQLTGMTTSLVPNAEDNDDLARWCTDATLAPTEGPQTATGRPGSGGAVNRPCP